MIGVGHDPTLASVVQLKLKAQLPNLKVFTWQPLIPIVQPRRKKGLSHVETYVEYMLVGYGPNNQSKKTAFCKCSGGRGVPGLFPTPEL